MSRVICLLSFLVLPLSNNAAASLEARKVELSTAASFQVFVDEGESFTLVNIPLRIGLYLTPYLEVEPEVVLTLVEDQDAASIFSANLAYHFELPSNGKSYIFVLAGAGFGNASPLHNSAGSVFGGGDRTATILNLGLGNKTFLTNSVAVRFEFRFQKFSFEGNSLQVHSGYLGFSVFLPED